MTKTNEVDEKSLLAYIKKHELVETSKVKTKRISEATLASMVGAARGFPLRKTLMMELTARHPYDEKGWMDFYTPGRWDIESNQVFMDPIRQTGPFAGEWEGTVGYGRFIAPEAGRYLAVINFSGDLITMNLSGPWGTKSVTTAPFPNTVGLVSGTKDLAKDEELWFDFSCKGLILGFLQSAQVYRVEGFIPFP